MIELQQVQKNFGSNEVLHSIDLRLEERKIYGLLGRNGVGKSTLLKLIAAQIRPTAGQIRVDGQDPMKSAEVRQRINLVKENGYGSDLRAQEILEAARCFFPNWDQDSEKRLLKKFPVPLRTSFDNLSRGNQTMLGLIIGIASRCPYTFFDEPSLGLDAANRYDFYHLLLEDYEEHPRTIIISTHLIDEVSGLFEEVIILKDTQVAVQNSVDELLTRYFSLQGRPEDLAAIREKHKLLGQESFGTSAIHYFAGSPEEAERAAWAEQGLTLEAISLQKLFVLLTEKGEGPGEAAGPNTQNTQNTQNAQNAQKEVSHV